jgi:hypothetical protein
MSSTRTAHDCLDMASTMHEGPTVHSRLLAGISRALILGGLASLSSRAAPTLPFPSQDQLREVQLAALSCARDNSVPSCSRTRLLVDPLLDHPRLPAVCKDQLWAISQKAQPAATNSFTRREAIEQPAQLMMLSCRSLEKPPVPPSASEGSGSGGRLRFGGR